MSSVLDGLPLLNPREKERRANNTFYYRHGSMYVLSPAARNKESSERDGAREEGGRRGWP